MHNSIDMVIYRTHEFKIQVDRTLLTIVTHAYLRVPGQELGRLKHIH